MGRAVRPTRAEDIGRLTEAELEHYITEAKRRIGAMTKAALRNNYRKQLLAAEQIKADRSD